MLQFELFNFIGLKNKLGENLIQARGWRSFKVGDIEPECKILCFLSLDLSGVVVDSVSDEGLGDCLLSVLFDRLDPSFNALEAGPVGDIVHIDNSVGFFVETLGESLVSLLACCVE